MRNINVQGHTDLDILSQLRCVLLYRISQSLLLSQQVSLQFFFQYRTFPQSQLDRYSGYIKKDHQKGKSVRHQVDRDTRQGFQGKSFNF